MMVRKGYRIFLVSVILCLFLGLATEAQEQDRYGGTLIVGTTANPTTMDWQSTRITAVHEIARHIWEGFMVFDTNGKIQPMLAKEWEVSEDGLTWTFYLREGVLFHNGKEMTAEDAAASARRWVEVTCTGGLEPIKSIEAIDKYTVEFKLDEPIGLLPVHMANHNGHPIIMPKEICEGVPVGKLPEYIGTGPYKFVEWKLDQHIKMEKFEDYKPIDLEPCGFAGKKYGYVDEIIFKFVPETSTLLAGLETGEFDIISPIQPTEVPRLSRNKDIELKKYPKWSLQVMFNFKSFLADQRLRHAMTMALDMDELMFLVGKDEENIEVTPGRFRESSIWYTGELEKYYNLKDKEGAKKLMQEVGYDGEEIIILTSKQYNWAFDVAIALEQQWSDIGFNVRLEVVDWPTLVSRRQEEEGWHVYTTAGTAACADPSFLATNFTGKSPGMYYDPEAADLMKRIAQKVDFEKRYDMWVELESLVAENPYAIFPGWLFEYKGFRKNIRGVTEEVTYWNVYKE